MLLETSNVPSAAHSGAWHGFTLHWYSFLISRVVFQSDWMFRPLPISAECSVCMLISFCVCVLVGWVFYSKSQKSTQVSWFAPYCCGKRPDLNYWGGKGYISLQLTAHYEGKPVQELTEEPGGRSWSRGEIVPGGLLSVASQPAFLSCLRPPARSWHYPQRARPSPIIHWLRNYLAFQPIN